MSVPVSATKQGAEVFLDEWVGPSHVDSHGHLKAGQILEWMDCVGVLAATRYCKQPVVTVSVDGLTLKAPIEVGSRVTLRAQVSYTSARSMGVHVNITQYQQNRPTDRVQDVRAYMVFVVLDENGKPLPIPQFEPSSPKEFELQREGTLRYEFRSTLKNDLNDHNYVESVATDQIPHVLREFFKRLPDLRAPWESQRKAGRRHHSYIHRVVPVFTGDLNFHGTLYGGKLMRWVEEAAALSSEAYLGGVPTFLWGLHGLIFLKPVTCHTFAHIRTRVVHTDKHSLTVLAEVQSEDPTKDQRDQNLRAFLTFKPAGRSTARIAALQCESEDEKKLNQEVTRRLALHRQVYFDG